MGDGKSERCLTLAELELDTCWDQHPCSSLVQTIVPDTKRYRSLEAETALVYPIGDHDYHDPIMHMVCSALEESWDDNPDDSVVTRTRLNIHPPEEYSGSSDLEVYKTFITGILQWLRLHGLLGVKYTETQVQFLGT